MIPDPTYDWLEAPVLKSSEVQSETEPDTKTVLTTKAMSTTESSPLPLQPSSVLPETLVVKEKLLKLTRVANSKILLRTTNFTVGNLLGTRFLYAEPLQNQ